MTKSAELTDMTNNELVGIYNTLNPDIPLKAWKGSKKVLVDRIEKLRKPLGPELTDVTTIRAAAIKLLCHVAYYEDRDISPDPASNIVPASSKNARSVGIAYDEIIRRIQDEFSGCKTTVACLRWYSVKIRAEEFGYENLTLPQRRPRVRPVRK